MHINTVANLEDIDIREAVKEYLVKRGLEVKSTEDVTITVSTHMPLLFSATVKVENKVLHEDKLRKPHSEPPILVPHRLMQLFYRQRTHAFMLDTSSALSSCFLCGWDKDSKMHQGTEARKPYSEPCPICGEKQYLDAPSTPGSEGTVRCPNAEKKWHGSHAFRLDISSIYGDCSLCGRDEGNRIHRITKQAGEQGAGTP